MWSSGEQLFRQRRVKKTVGSMELWGTDGRFERRFNGNRNLEDGFLPRDLAGNLK
jgi:hypothetical protein